MRPLLLTDYGLSLRTRGGDLEVFNRTTNLSVRYPTKTLDFDTVIAHHLGGFVTWPALRWLANRGVSLFILDFDGKPIYSAMPDYPINGPLRLAQYHAHYDRRRRFELAKWIVSRKLGKPIPPTIRSLRRLLKFEADEAHDYFSKLGVRRDHYRARDVENALMNYGFGLLESAARRAVHARGLDPAIGFVHESNPWKSSLVYDVMEPFRAEVTTLALSEREKARTVDTFKRGLRLRPETASRLVQKFEREFDETKVLAFVQEIERRISP